LLDLRGPIYKEGGGNETEGKEGNVEFQHLLVSSLITG